MVSCEYQILLLKNDNEDEVELKIPITNLKIPTLDTMISLVIKFGIEGTKKYIISTVEKELLNYDIEIKFNTIRYNLNLNYTNLLQNSGENLVKLLDYISTKDKYIIIHNNKEWTNEISYFLPWDEHYYKFYWKTDEITPNLFLYIDLYYEMYKKSNLLENNFNIYCKFLKMENTISYDVLSQIFKFCPYYPINIVNRLYYNAFRKYIKSNIVFCYDNDIIYYTKYDKDMLITENEFNMTPNKGKLKYIGLLDKNNRPINGYANFIFQEENKNKQYIGPVINDKRHGFCTIYHLNDNYTFKCYFLYDILQEPYTFIEDITYESNNSPYTLHYTEPLYGKTTVTHDIHNKTYFSNIEMHDIMIETKMKFFSYWLNKKEFDLLLSIKNNNDKYYDCVKKLRDYFENK
jgi:hypothetical protein